MRGILYPDHNVLFSQTKDISHVVLSNSEEELDEILSLVLGKNKRTIQREEDMQSSCHDSVWITAMYQALGYFTL